MLYTTLSKTCIFTPYNNQWTNDYLETIHFNSWMDIFQIICFSIKFWNSISGGNKILIYVIFFVWFNNYFHYHTHVLVLCKDISILTCKKCETKIIKLKHNTYIWKTVESDSIDHKTLVVYVCKHVLYIVQVWLCVSQWLAGHPADAIIENW